MRVRAQAYYFSLTAPALTLCVLFFLVPLGAVLARSFQGGPRGLLVEDEVVTESGAGAIRVAHVPLAKTSGDRAGPPEVRAKGVRSVGVHAVEAVTGTVTLAEALPADQFAMVSYNDVPREIVLGRSGTDAIQLVVKHPPIIDRDGDGRVSPADVHVWVERALNVTTIDAGAGRLRLTEWPMEGERVLVTYRYVRPTTLVHYARI
ncbi:MAG: hypothetical protein C5B48_07660, partial [Candidatus Rokuibacteriota bacterium]